MNRLASLLVFGLAGIGLLSAGDSDPVFRSDVSLVRVDARVVDRDNRTITGLSAQDFVLSEQGKTVQIRNFAREDMPVDVLFLFDVSVSMRPHVERVVSAAGQALQDLGKDDRVGIMVFDRSTRLRLAFRSVSGGIQSEFDSVLHHESFNGGTDITRGLLDAINYVARSARKDARRAIIILTDDQTERDRDVARVSLALTQADTVLSALIAPDAMGYRSGWPGRGGSQPGGSYPGGSYPGGSRRGGGFPGGGSYPGDIIFGRRGGGYPGGGGGSPGSRYPGSGSPRGGPHTQSAGTAEIAQESGGDSMPVDDASALETTLTRIRQRYSLYFSLPEGAKAGEQRTVDVALAQAAGRRFPNAEVQFRRTYLTPTDLDTVARAKAAGAQDPKVDTPTAQPAPTDPTPAPAQAAPKRRAVLDQYEGPRGPNPAVGAAPTKPPN